jgi:nucleotide-binding universal stress UspA family protein
MYNHILIPTDGSNRSRAAARSGVKLAKALGARVTAFFAAPAATPLVYSGLLPVAYTTSVRHAALIEKTAATYLGVIEKACAAAGVACHSVHVTNEFAADAILEVARKRKCDLIVMASHGRRGLSSLLLGSVTQKVLTRSKVPVLVYR